LQNFIAKKPIEDSLKEKIQDLYFGSQIHVLRDYYRSLVGEENFKQSLSSVNRYHTYPGLFPIEFYFLKDASLLSALSRELNALVTFIESTFMINIGTITTKFAICKETGRPVFLGAGSCYFQFKTHEMQSRLGISSDITTETLLRKCGSRDFRELVQPTKQYTDNNCVLPDIVNKYSQKLLTTMLKDKCQGDFCTYKIIQSYEENLLVLNDAINLEKIPLGNKLPGNVMGKDLHYCIFYNLILKTRKQSREVINLLRKNNYIPSEVDTR
jgi:hypothetical protein